MTNDPSPQENPRASQPLVTPPQASGTHPEVPDAAAEPQHPFFVQEDLPPFLDDDGHEDWGTGFAAPFQLSEPIAVLQPDPPGGTGTPPSPPHSAGSHRWTWKKIGWMKIGLIITALVLALGFLSFSLFAQASPPLTTPASRQYSPATAQSAHTPAPKAPPPALPMPPGNAIPASLPVGWTQAGLTLGDALFAERTATTFTDREMSLDYQNVGTRTQHGGTMTAATFILTPAARLRFQQNDVRVATNQLYDRVVNQHLIQSVVAAQPQLVAFQIHGQQPFAWVDVAFTLWQSTTGQSRVHHMVVLLLRVDPATQGTNAPMGGTGWLVSNYTLDQPGNVLPDIVEPA